MSAEDNLATVKGIYEAFGAGDVEAILAQLTDDVDWAADAASDAAPWWGPHNGKDQVPNFFAALGENTEVSEFEPVGFAANDDEVMVFLRFSFTVTATGKSGSSNLHHYWRFRDGKVDYYRGSEDTLQTSQMLAG
jgi:ketosteroid isomerase-like protein